MSDFNDWCERQDIFNGNVANQDCQWALKFMRQSFEAGQQSQQAKIDELQVRIDEAMDYIAESGGVNLTSEMALNDILKGNKDEN